MSDDRRTEAPSAVLVSVGEELLLGETVDSNAAWIASRLSGLGVRVLRKHTVGDVDEDIRSAVREGLAAAPLVVVTGGLGPTSDDRTRDAVAELLEVPLERDDAYLERLRTRFREMGYGEMPERNVSQALVPAGARVLPNERGTAPGLALPDDGRWVVLLPGVPREMKGIFEESVEPLVRETFGARLEPVRQRMIRTTGIAESELAERIDDALPDDMGPVEIAFLPDTLGVDLRLTARGAGGGEEAEAALDRVEEALGEVVSEYRYDRGEGEDLVDSISRALEERGLVMATAESCTGGLVAKRMTDRPGSSTVFVGGVVAYANEAKEGLLGVEEAVLVGHGAVSEAVARAMAEGVVRRLGADAGIGITGVAGPGGGTEEKPVGLVHWAVTLEDRTEARHRVFPGDREDIRERSAQAALALLFRMLREGHEGSR